MKTGKFFSNFGTKYFSKYFPELSKELKTKIMKSNLELVYNIYLGKMLFFTVLTFLVSILAMAFLSILFSFELTTTVLLIIGVPIVAGAFVMMFGYYYPSYLLKKNEEDIEANMPFAVNHMAAVVSSGAKPSAMFEFLSKNNEYGEISKEAGYISRNMDVLGMDMTTAIREVAKRTPSKKFSDFLLGLVGEIKGGGDLKVYLKKAAEDSLFDYRVRRDRYLTLLSNYADIYIAVLIVAPLFFVAILSIMSIVGGQIGGFGIKTLMEIGVYAILPMLSLIFLVFVHATQPKT